MSAWNARTEAAREDAASADSEEKDVKIPVEDANEVKVQDADVEGADTAEPSEEEMVAAAIAAGEQAANDDFKLKYEAACDELAELRNQVEDAEEAKKAAEDKAHEAADRVNRLQADWENYRRRTAKERLEERDRATEKLIGSLLPVVDDMERAIEHARTQQLDDASRQFVDGVDAVRAKLMSVFEHEGVEAIDPAGEAFDPNIHQAVGRVEDAAQYDETVNDVYQKGYRMAGKVLRPAMVTVTYGGEKRPAEEPKGDTAEE